jgi:hypothetical protein
MSESVGLISVSLGEYRAMIVQSQASMDNLSAMLFNLEENLPGILNGIVIGVSLFLVWLLAAQVVILSQGWELYQEASPRSDSREEGTG